MQTASVHRVWLKHQSSFNGKLSIEAQCDHHIVFVQEFSTYIQEDCSIIKIYRQKAWDDGVAPSGKLYLGTLHFGLGNLHKWVLISF